MKSYKLLTDSKTGTFEKMIEAHINDGWALHGGTFFSDRRFAQAVTKEQRAANKRPDPRKGKSKTIRLEEEVTVTDEQSVTTNEKVNASG